MASSKKKWVGVAAIASALAALVARMLGKKPPATDTGEGIPTATE